MVSLASRQELWRGTNYCWSPGVYWSASGQYQSFASVRCADKNNVQRDSRALGHRGGFDCGIIISQETDVDFEFVDVDAFDQLYHSMNESKVMVKLFSFLWSCWSFWYFQSISKSPIHSSMELRAIGRDDNCCDIVWRRLISPIILNVLLKVNLRVDLPRYAVLNLRYGSSGL